MSGLDDFVVQTKLIEFKRRSEDFSFEVRGLTFNDMTRLVTNHVDDLEDGLKLYKSLQADVYARKNLDRFILAIGQQMPGLAGEIIAVAADKPAWAKIAATIPLSVTLAALSEIFRMTLEDVGGLKNALATLAGVLDALLPPEMLESLQDAGKFLRRIGMSEPT